MLGKVTYRLTLLAIAMHAIGWLASVALGEDPKAPTHANRIEGTIHDGDTVTKATVHLDWGVTLYLDKGVRAWGYDCWEVNRTRQTVNVTDVEIERGKEARDALVALLENGGTLWAEYVGTADPFGRWDAVLWVRTKQGEWIYLAAWMEEHDFLRTPRGTRASGVLEK